ncbi:MAG TPA: aminopeptidase N [Mycobacteriales bacterium]|jgi:aminopeptidase N|nr:aminopeptidase N [Mycobacteriales bacterium]
MRTLTRDEARTRAQLLDVTSYAVELDLTGLVDGPSFTSSSEVRFACRQPGATTFLELDGELLALERDGLPVEAVLQGNRIVLADLAAQEVVRVVARCSTTRTGEGLHRAVDPADGEVYLYAQAFLDDAQRMFACFDQPDLKARVQLTVTAPEAWQVLANTRAERVGRRHVFAPTEPIATYLVTLAAGPWHGERRWYGDSIELGVWCRRSLAAHLEADELFTITAACLDVQQEVFGRRYPFGDSYDQVFVPEFNAGAMENPGMVTFTDETFVFRSRTTEGRRRLRAQVIAHEMAHMWFGDLVTMRWWDDLWLNESFAELLGVYTVDRCHALGTLPYAGAWADFCLGRKAWGYRADQLPTTHPVAGDVADNRAALLNFDGISYAKGASALRQLSAWLGEDAFFAGVRGYLERHAWGSTGLADLLAALEQAGGRDLQDWARVWLRTPGVPVLRVLPGAGGAGELRQEAAVLRPHRVGVGAYDDDGTGVLRLTERVELDVVGAATPFALPPALLVVPNDGDLTFAKVRFDAASLAVVLTRTGDLADPLTRAVVWGALWDAARDGELGAAQLVDAVVAGVGAETDPDVAATLLAQARFAAQRWSTTSTSLVERLHAHSVAAVRKAEAGSDLQLVHLRAAASCAADGTQLQGWLAGRDLPEGVGLDADLRWHLLERLAALGEAGPEQIATELAGDRTASGELHAAHALAARPDADAKATVWAELLGEGSLPNGRARALASGFWQPGQDDLLRPYAGRWAAEVPALFERRTPALATTIARLLFPATLVEPATLQATEIRPGGDLPAGLSRVLLEERDDLARALRARGA